MTPIHKETLWLNIAKQLEQEIQEGCYPKDTLLPSENQLAQRFSAHRHTIRKAIHYLEDAMLVQTERGRGTMVLGQRILYPISKRTRFTENLNRMHLSHHRDIIRINQRPCSHAVADALQLTAEQDRVWRVDQISMIEESIPLDYSSYYVPVQRFLDWDIRIKQHHGGITETFKSYGIDDYIRGQTLIWANSANQKEAELLQIRLATPLLIQESINTDMDGNPIQYTIARFVGPLSQFSIDV